MTKHVETLLIPRLDEGSNPSTSTKIIVVTCYDDFVHTLNQPVTITTSCDVVVLVIEFLIFKIFSRQNMRTHQENAKQARLFFKFDIPAHFIQVC